MNCLYCKRPSHEARGKAHVFPEAVVQNAHTLPLGAVCDPCNNYFGATLDTVLLYHPIIALSVQLLGLPGKKGIPRRQAGVVRRDSAGRYIDIPCEEGEMRQKADGTCVANVSVQPSPEYDDPRFARALHHIGLNTFALTAGLAAAGSQEFDAVRRYVRSPPKGEWWPYGVYSFGLEPIRKRVRVQGVPNAPGKTLHLTIFNLDFYVDLLNTGELGHWCRANLPPGARFGPALPRTKRAPKTPRYEVRIYLDDSKPGDPD